MFNKEKLIDDFIRNEKKFYMYQKNLKYFCDKYNIDTWPALSYYGEALEKMKAEHMI